MITGKTYEDGLIQGRADCLSRVVSLEASCALKQQILDDKIAVLGCVFELLTKLRRNGFSDGGSSVGESL